MFYFIKYVFCWVFLFRAPCKHDLSAVFPGSRLDAYMDMNMLLNEPTGPTEKAKS